MSTQPERARMLLPVLITLLTLMPQAGAARPKKTPDAPQPYARVWRYETAAMTGLRAGADEGIVVVPLADGRLVALDPNDGDLLWSADFGGQVSAPPLVTSTAVYVAIARQGSDSQGVLRAVDRATGLALWVRDLAKPVVSEMAFYENRIYCGSADGSVYAIRTDTGAPVWAFATRGSVRGHVALFGDEVLVGSDDGALYAIDREKGIEDWRYQTGGPVVGRPLVAPRRVVFTSGDGSAYAIDPVTRRLIWRSRTGAAIEAGPALVGDAGVLVASFDNFVYLLDAKSGDRVWKRRMRGRLVSDPLPDGGDRAIVAPLRDDRLTVIGLANGNKLAAFALDPGDELVGPPTLVGNLLLLPTDTGLLAARAVERR
jgi:outer membrane protein assembly factor BamB